MGIIIVGLVCSSCRNAYTINYLLQHPNLLHSEFIHCQLNRKKTPYCNQVNQAAEKWLTSVEIFHKNPARFGEYIMQAERDLVAAQERLKRIQSEQDQSTQNINQVNLIYQEQLQKVNILLAVVRIQDANY